MRTLLVCFSFLFVAQIALAREGSRETMLNERCAKELGQIHSFALREAERLNQLLVRAKEEIDTLSPREKIRAKVKWIEADSARLELEKSLVAAAVTETEACAISAEAVRASLFRSQELSFTLSTLQSPDSDLSLSHRRGALHPRAGR